jgi:hypothetical protein
MGVKQYLDKFKTGRGKWKEMSYEIFFLWELNMALIKHVKTNLHEKY